MLRTLLVLLVTFFANLAFIAKSQADLASLFERDLSAQDSIQLSVIDTYIELHSGPGRGYPATHTIEQGEPVNVHRRRGNWYLVTDKRGREGWVLQEKLARTIAPSGLPAALPEIQHGDYLAQKWRIGYAAGKLDNDETASVVAGFRLLSIVSIEAEYSQIFGDDLDGDSYGANILVEPIQSLAFTPFLSAGLGELDFSQKTTRSTGQDEGISGNYHQFGAGINYYIGLNFVVRGEYRQVRVKGKNGSTSSPAWQIGFSSFF